VAYTLIELMTVLSVSSTILVVSIGWIVQSMKFASFVKASQQQHQCLMRVGSLLRDDVHQGRELRIDGDHRLVISTVGSQVIVYQIETGRLTRAVRNGDATIAVDTFSIDETAKVRWEVSEMPGQIGLVVLRGNRWIRATSGPKVDETTDVPPDLYVRAAVNRYSSTKDPTK
jgi:type II secretory pathway pseudopilin PulG